MSDPPADMTKSAQPGDWKTRPLPRLRADLTLSRSFSSEEMQAIRHGVIPAQMEDKWFIYWRDDRLHCHRSWTGICIYVARFEPDGGGARLVGAAVNRNPEQYGSTDDEQDARLLEYVIDAVLLRREVEFPEDPGMPGPAVVQAWTEVGRAALGQHPGQE
ncbi:MAG: hypothetical protein IH621_00860 [Krumholzibacteria bacterium]|nr:hypothetical protein [Candidatus Krumholzibacteria bacterium]